MDDRGSAGEGASSAILFEDGPVFFRLTRLTLICEVIRYRLVQIRQNPKKRLFGLAARNRLSLSLFLFHSLLRLTSFLSQYKNISHYVQRLTLQWITLGTLLMMAHKVETAVQGWSVDPMEDVILTHRVLKAR